MLDNLPRGKGIWLRRITVCENGDLDALVARARAASFTHVILKIADGADPYNLDPSGPDHALELAARLTAAGIGVWGWQQIYGDTPLFKGALRPDYHLSEAECALARLEELRAAGARGFVVVAGGDYERAHNRERKAEQYSAAVRSGLGDFPIALSAWKYPHRHPRFPWAEFRAQCNLDLPQIFWIGRHGEAAKQLETSTQRFSVLNPRLPYVPAGPAFFEHNWRPAPDDLVAFFEKAIALGLPAANLWEWDDLGLRGDESHNLQHLDFREHWKAVAEFEWMEPARVPFWLREPEAAEAVQPMTPPERPALSPVAAPPQPAAPTLAPLPEPEEEFEPARPYHPDDEEIESEFDFAPALSFALEPEETDELPEWLQEPGPTIEAETPISFGIEAEAEFEPVRPYHPDVEDVEPGPAAFALEAEEFEPVRPYHPEVEVEPVADSEVHFALEVEEAALPEWLQEVEAVEPSFPAELGEAFEPVLPYRPPAEPGPISEPDLRLALEIEEAALPDWLREPELIPAAPEPLLPAEPAEEFVPVRPYPPVPPAEPLPPFTPGIEEAAPSEPLEPQPAAVPEEAFEPVRPYSPDEEEPESEFDFAPAFGLVPEIEDEELPEWLHETEPGEGRAPEPATAAAEEDFEPVRPYHADDEELEFQPEAPLAFGPVPETEDEALPEWLRETEPGEERPSELATAEAEEAFEPARPYHADAEELEFEPEAPLAFSLVPEIEDDDLPEWLREAEPAAEAELEPEAAPRPEPAAAPSRSLVMAPAAPTLAEGDTVSQFFSALRTGRLDEALALYGPEFSHVNPDRVERDRAALRNFYEQMLQRIEGAGLVWLFMRRSRLAANVQWVTCDKAGRPMQGVDSFHLNRNGQIVYHHTSFSPGAE